VCHFVVDSYRNVIGRFMSPIEAGVEKRLFKAGIHHQIVVRQISLHVRCETIGKLVPRPVESWRRHVLSKGNQNKKN
jgi:hypothetical protein